jgi:hypothetical protein
VLRRLFGVCTLDAEKLPAPEEKVAPETVKPDLPGATKEE